MTREDIIRMAREADVWVVEQEPYQTQLERFAALIASRVAAKASAAAKAEEREACAKLVESRKTGANELMDAVRDMEAAAIRARGENK